MPTSLPYFDDFNRADEPNIRPPWLAVGSPSQLKSHLFMAANPDAQFAVALYNGADIPANQYLGGTLAQLRNGKGYAALVLRADDTLTNFYYIDLDGIIGGIGLLTPVNIQKFVDGHIVGPPFRQLGYLIPAIGDNYYAEIIGGVITFKRDGVVVGSYEDPNPIASGKFGLLAQLVDGAVPDDIAWANFEGGSTENIAPPLPTPEPGQSDGMRFYLREANSDVSDMRQLSDLQAGVNYELDYTLGPPYQTMNEIEDFVSTPQFPGKAVWEKGTYLLNLIVAEAPGMTCNAEVWRVDANGVDIAQVGSDQQGVSGPGLVQFSFDAEEIAVDVTDRIMVKLFAQNDANENLNFGIRASMSNLITPIQPKRVRRYGSADQRGKFLGRLKRSGEQRNDPDGFFPV